jgi:hypothetical protein
MSAHSSEFDNEFIINNAAGHSIVHEYTPSDSGEEYNDNNNAPRPSRNEDVVITEHAYARDGSESDHSLDSPTALEHSHGVKVNQYVLREALGKGKHGVVRACYAEDSPDKILVRTFSLATR